MCTNKKISDDEDFLMVYDNERDCADLDETRLVGRYELKEAFELSAETVVTRVKKG